MQKRGNRICPCCGKELQLIPPSKELLPSRVGCSSNEVQYYLPSKKYYFNRTSNPSGHYSQPAANALHYNGNMSSKLIKYDKSGWHIVPIRNTEEKLKRGGLCLFSPEIVFHCSECKKKLSLNFNPFNIPRLLLAVLFIITAAFALTALVFPNLFFVLVGIIAGCLGLVIAVAAGGCIYTRIFLSNFIHTDEFDNVISPKPDLSVSTASLKKSYLCESNVFSLSIDNKVFYVYLTTKCKDKLELSICGINGEPERLKSLLREKMSHGEKVSLSLEFEGKKIGTAEVGELLNSSCEE